VLFSAKKPSRQFKIGLFMSGLLVPKMALCQFVSAKVVLCQFKNWFIYVWFASAKNGFMSVC
jgi:hypothetical protein